MHYAVFWLFKGHIILLHYTAKTTGIIQAYLFIFSRFFTASSEQKSLSQWLVIVVLVLDVVYG